MTVQGAQYLNYCKLHVLNGERRWEVVWDIIMITSMAVIKNNIYKVCGPRGDWRTDMPSRTQLTIDSRNGVIFEEAETLQSFWQEQIDSVIRTSTDYSIYVLSEIAWPGLLSCTVHWWAKTFWPPLLSMVLVLSIALKAALTCWVMDSTGFRFCIQF